MKNLMLHVFSQCLKKNPKAFNVLMYDFYNKNMLSFEIRSSLRTLASESLHVLSKVKKAFHVLHS